MANILFAHPDQKLAGIYQRHLGRRATVDSVTDGLAALRYIKPSRPKLVVAECPLPLLSGLGLLRYLRRHPEYYDLPFIFLSNAAMPLEALDYGATGWWPQSDYHPRKFAETILPYL